MPHPADCNAAPMESLDAAMETTALPYDSSVMETGMESLDAAMETAMVGRICMLLYMQTPVVPQQFGWTYTCMVLFIGWTYTCMVLCPSSSVQPPGTCGRTAACPSCKSSQSAVQQRCR
jgi:hypothetical protein